MGFFEKIKARLALRGDQEKRTVTRAESYSPVMALPTFRILLSMYAADLDVEYIHGDVTAAFVSSAMKRDVYVYLPAHLCPEGEEKVVYKLEKALYGRTQYLIWLVESMGGTEQGTVKVHVDCASVIDWATSPINPTRNCHVHARYFYCRDMVKAGVVEIVKVASEFNLADLMVTFKDKFNFLFLSSRVKEGRNDNTK